MTKHAIPAHVREQQINSLPNITFVRWDGEYRNNKSKCVCRCDAGHEWKASVSHLVSNGRGCPQCALRNVSERFRMPEIERITQINSIDGVSFVRWCGEYHSNKSRVVCRCDKGHEWTAVINSIVDTGRRCPQCASSGYDRTKPATLYALRSECGTMVKIGISNNIEQRHAILKRKTPFAFECVELCHGDGGMVATLEKVLHGLMEPIVFDTPFDGSTEWRKWDARLPEWFDLYRSWS